MATPPKVCECGCGEITRVSEHNDASYGYVKGEHRRFARGHQNRIQTPAYTVDPDVGCWVWSRSQNQYGYGLTSRQGKSALAHRVYYEREHGPIPAGLDLDHLCRNRACVNPAHLEPVTRAVNLRRGLGIKLSIEVARAIRGMAGQLGMSHRKLAALHQADHRTVGRIIRNEAWREV